MATLNTTINLNASGVSSIPVSLSVQMTATLTGGLDAQRFTMADASRVIASNSSYGSSLVFVKNLSTVAAQHIQIGTNNANDNAMVSVDFDLQDGEWAFFPWNGTVDLEARAVSGTPVLEVIIFER
tara:strand:- start:1645 stop:2022 length:378 start_codon:yes stop_codon:yes gene_type:complete